MVKLFHLISYNDLDNIIIKGSIAKEHMFMIIILDYMEYRQVNER